MNLTPATTETLRSIVDAHRGCLTLTFRVDNCAADVTGGEALAATFDALVASGLVAVAVTTGRPPCCRVFRTARHYRLTDAGCAAIGL